MKTESPYFELRELVCPDVYKIYNESAWGFFDPRLIVTINRIREKIGKPITVNTWNEGGEYSQRGFRCIQCSLVKKAFDDNRIYCSPHMRGMAVDFDVQGLVAEEVRLWIAAKQNLLPYSVRLEKGTSWVHLDVVDADKGKVYVFAP